MARPPRWHVGEEIQLSAPKAQARSEEASLSTNDCPFVLVRRLLLRANAGQAEMRWRNMMKLLRSRRLRPSERLLLPMKRLQLRFKVSRQRTSARRSAT